VTGRGAYAWRIVSSKVNTSATACFVLHVKT